MWFKRRQKGTEPTGWSDVNYMQDFAQHDYQTKWTYPWPNVPAHEQRSALVNNWSGNQLPGFTNFVPGVPLSTFVWNVPTSYANSLRNQQYNSGFNIQGYSAYQNATLLQQVQMQWQARGQ